jgi:signal peptidase I
VSPTRTEKTGSARGAKANGKKKSAAPRAATKPAPEPDAPLWRSVWDQVGPIAIAVLIALAIRAVIIESYYVPSGSMLETLYIGDHVFVSKFTFGAHIPFIGVKLPALRDPKRGEITVFALGRGPGGAISPLDICPKCDSEGFVKRIVGLPGDTLEYRDRKLIVNGKAMEQRDLAETFTDESGTKMRVLEEDLDGCRHHVLQNPTRGPIAMERITVPADHYFMMGDNRDNSNDSRFWGTVHRDDLKGPVLINYWSWNNNRSWLAMLNPITWIQLLFGEVRWNRIGMTFACESGPAPASARESEPVPEKRPTAPAAGAPRRGER